MVLAVVINKVTTILHAIVYGSYKTYCFEFNVFIMSTGTRIKSIQSMARMTTTTALMLPAITPPPDADPDSSPLTNSVISVNSKFVIGLVHKLGICSPGGQSGD